MDINNIKETMIFFIFKINHLPSVIMIFFDKFIQTINLKIFYPKKTHPPEFLGRVVRIKTRK